MSFWSGLNQKKGMAFLDKAGKGLKMFSWQQRPLTSSRNMKACTIKEMVITLTAFEVLVSYESVWILNLSGEWKTKEKHSFYTRWTQIRAQVARCTWGPHNARGTQMHQTITNMCPAIYVQTSSRPDFLTWFFLSFPSPFLIFLSQQLGRKKPQLKQRLERVRVSNCRWRNFREFGTGSMNSWVTKWLIRGGYILS